MRIYKHKNVNPNARVVESTQLEYFCTSANTSKCLKFT